MHDDVCIVNYLSRDMRFPTMWYVRPEKRLRPACAYAQSDQSLCWSLEFSRSIKLMTEHHLEYLSLKGSYMGLSESTLDKIPQCWKLRVTAHLYDVFTGTYIPWCACTRAQADQCICFPTGLFSHNCSLYVVLVWGFVFISQCFLVWFTKSNMRGGKMFNYRQKRENSGTAPYFSWNWSWNNFYSHSPPFRRIIQEGCSRLWCLTVSLLLSHWYPGQVWYLIVSIPDLCTLTYFDYQSCFVCAVWRP